MIDQLRSQVIYPGTFDPFHNGHLDIVKRASESFQKVIVAVSTAPTKMPLFSVDERIAMIREIVKDMDNVRVSSFDGLLVKYVLSTSSRLILRGMRAVTDFEYEFQMALANRSIEPRIETLFMVTSPEYAYLSSATVKEIWRLGGEVSNLIPSISLSCLLSKDSINHPKGNPAG